MADNNTSAGERLDVELVGPTAACHLTVDPHWDLMTVIEYGSVWDGQPAELQATLEEDDRIGLLLRRENAEGGEVVGFSVADPHAVDVKAIDAPELWSSPRFTVPTLGLRDASIGEIVLVVQARFAEDEPTADAIVFHQALAAQADEEWEAAATFFRLAIEAGDMKAHFGLGYSLCELEEHGAAYDHLRLYTELTPHNAWAWNWLGQACEALGDLAEARKAYRRAVEIEAAGGLETDAGERLEELEDA